MAPKQTDDEKLLVDFEPNVASLEEEVKVKSLREVVWKNVAAYGYIHLAALYGLALMFTSAKLYTTIWAIFLHYIGGLGITAGAHRLWSHKSYKAKLPLRILLAVFNTLAMQNSIFKWVRDHRIHHKYTDTNADPYNSRRGFFFSHIGWLFVRKHPSFWEKGKEVYLSDLMRDPIVMFQHRNYKILVILIAIIIPTIIPVYLWNETWTNAWFVTAVFRHCLTLNVTFLVNSAAHMWGYKPYDKTITPTDNTWVSFGALGEGWHNYHHVFPWDYKTSELGDYPNNITTAFIDFFAKLGQAYDLKTVPRETAIKRSKKTGDGSHPDSNVWGWNDSNMPKEDREETLILNGY